MKAESLSIYEEVSDKDKIYTPASFGSPLTGKKDGEIIILI